MDRYAYVNNNPMNYVDPSGHESVCHHANSDPECNRPDTWDFPLNKKAQQLLSFAKSMGMTPEEVIGIGLGHEMYGETVGERAIHMGAYRNGFLRHVHEGYCSGNPTYNCMLNYFASSYESVYNQFLDDGVYTTFWETQDDYIFDQVDGNLSEDNQAVVEAGKKFIGNFMDTISLYSYDEKLALNSGVVNALAVNKALGGYPTAADGFLIIKSVTCPNTGANGYSLVYNLKGETALGDHGIKTC